MDRHSHKFMIEMEQSSQSPRFNKKNLDHLRAVDTQRRKFMTEMEKSRKFPRFYKKNYSYDIAEEEEKPSTLQKIIWNISDYFVKDELMEPRRNSFKIKDIEEWRKRPKEKSEFKIRSVRDLIDRWYFKSLAKDLINIQPEPLKMKTKMRCLNYILDAQKTNYSNTVYTDTYESQEDE